MLIVLQEQELTRLVGGLSQLIMGGLSTCAGLKYNLVISVWIFFTILKVAKVEGCKSSSYNLGSYVF